MTNEDFYFVNDIVRCAMFNATSATQHQIKRLIAHLSAHGYHHQAKTLQDHFTPPTDEEKAAKLVQS